MLRKNFLLGVGITNENEERILEYLLLSLKKTHEKYYIVTPNPEITVYAYDNPEYLKVLNGARIALPDGIGVFLGSALMGHVLKERITGVEFMLEVCKRAAEQPITVGFLGGRGGVAERTAQCLKALNPQLDVIFVAEEWGEGGFDLETKSKIKNQKSSKNSYLLARSPSLPLPAGRQGRRGESTGQAKIKKGIDILFVAFGAPRQEEWIYENLEKLPVKIAMGVGGAFDFISGEVERAPFLVRAMGFEWLYRLKKQPWRWKRQMALGRFVWLLLKERMKFIKL